MVSEVEHLFIFTRVLSPEKCLFRFFARFLIGLFEGFFGLVLVLVCWWGGGLLLSCRSSYVFWISALYQIHGL